MQHTHFLLRLGKMWGSCWPNSGQALPSGDFLELLILPPFSLAAFRFSVLPMPSSRARTRIWQWWVTSALCFPDPHSFHGPALSHLPLKRSFSPSLITQTFHSTNLPHTHNFPPQHQFSLSPPLHLYWDMYLNLKVQIFKLPVDLLSTLCILLLYSFMFYLLYSVILHMQCTIHKIFDFCL